MSKEQEDLVQFGIIIFLMIFIFSVSSCERKINYEKIEELERQIKETI